MASTMTQEKSKKVFLRISPSQLTFGKRVSTALKLLLGITVILVGNVDQAPTNGKEKR